MEFDRSVTKRLSVFGFDAGHVDRTSIKETIVLNFLLLITTKRHRVAKLNEMEIEIGAR